MSNDKLRATAEQAEELLAEIVRRHIDDLLPRESFYRECNTTAKALRAALADSADREMICEAHPWLPWPHGKCGGPGCPVTARDVLLRDRISGLSQAVKQRETIIADFYHATADAPHTDERTPGGVMTEITEGEYNQILKDGQRITALEEALQRIRDYATPGYRNMASAELALDGVYKTVCDALADSADAPPELTEEVVAVRELLQEWLGATITFRNDELVSGVTKRTRQFLPVLK